MFEVWTLGDEVPVDVPVVTPVDAPVVVPPAPSVQAILTETYPATPVRTLDMPVRELAWNPNYNVLRNRRRAVPLHTIYNGSGGDLVMRKKRKPLVRAVPGTSGTDTATDKAEMEAANAPATPAPSKTPAAKESSGITLGGMTFSPWVLAAAGGGLLLLVWFMANAKKGK